MAGGETDRQGVASGSGPARAVLDLPTNSTSARLVDTAAALFRRKGYAESTTRELAELLGIRKASLYHHIQTKEDLLYEICITSLRSITEKVTAAGRAAGPETKLGSMIHAHVVEAVQARDMHAVMLSEMRGLTAEHRREVVLLRDKYEKLIYDSVALDQKDGYLRRDIDAKHLTLALLNVLNWTIFWFDPEGDLSAEALGSVLSTVYLEGAAAPESRRQQ
ncbi:MAG: TetR/AcrR family transcriptional regulator [Acidimicrobiales bacterium]